MPINFFQFGIYETGFARKIFFLAANISCQKIFVMSTRIYFSTRIIDNFSIFKVVHQLYILSVKKASTARFCQSKNVNIIGLMLAGSL